MSIDDILKHKVPSVKYHDQDEKQNGDIRRALSRVKDVDINALEQAGDGVWTVKSMVSYNDGRREALTIRVKQEDIDRMVQKLQDHVAGQDVVVTDDDGIVAIVRKVIDPKDDLNWFWSPNGDNGQQINGKWFADADLGKWEKIDADDITTDDFWANDVRLGQEYYYDGRRGDPEDSFD